MIDSAAFDFAWQGVRGVDRYGFLICFQSQIRVFDGGSKRIWPLETVVGRWRRQSVNRLVGMRRDERQWVA